MPWRVKKAKGSGWDIIKTTTNKIVGHSDTKEKAEASVKARYANTNESITDKVLRALNEADNASMFLLEARLDEWNVPPAVKKVIIGFGLLAITMGAVTKTAHASEIANAFKGGDIKTEIQSMDSDSKDKLLSATEREIQRTQDNIKKIHDAFGKPSTDLKKKVLGQQLTKETDNLKAKLAFLDGVKSGSIDLEKVNKDASKDLAKKGIQTDKQGNPRIPGDTKPETGEIKYGPGYKAPKLEHPVTKTGPGYPEPEVTPL